MEDLLSEIDDYLPIYYLNPDNGDYINYLYGVFSATVASQHFQFSLTAFHMLYMSFIYKIIWQLNKFRESTIMTHVKSNEKLAGLPNSQFVLSVEDEKRIFKWLKCLDFHPSELDDFASVVDKRDHCSHATGKILYLERDVARHIEEELHYMDLININDKLNDFLKKLYSTFILDNYDPEKREFSTIEDATDSFIKQNLLSIKDLQILSRVIPDEMHQSSSNLETLYKKIIHLVFLSVASKYINSEENLFLKYLPMLMNGFERQNKISFGVLAINNFTQIIQGFSEVELVKFKKITKFDIEKV